jgi:hypothetical protein
MAAEALEHRFEIDFAMTIAPEFASSAPIGALRKRSSCFHAALTVIFFSAFWASAVFGSFTVSTPLAKLASILSVSTPSGSWNERWKEP